eukprot:Skav200993  [mRNA]  locus=scaffold991:87577:91231:+ [translate_table: standard]
MPSVAPAPVLPRKIFSATSTDDEDELRLAPGPWSMDDELQSPGKATPKNGDEKPQAPTVTSQSPPLPNAIEQADSASSEEEQLEAGAIGGQGDGCYGAGWRNQDGPQWLAVANNQLSLHQQWLSESY